MSKRVQVWSCGGGVQSCGIAVLIIQGRLPKPDLAVIADTEYEKQSTWDYYESTLKPELAKVGVDLVRVKKTEWATKARRQIFRADGECVMPIYIGNEKEGARAKFGNNCTGRWKIDTIQRYLSHRGVTASKRRTWLGFSADEPKRWIKKINDPQFWIPLVSAVRLRRFECISLVEKFGWPKPPRSACWMCPNHDEDEWRDIKENSPEEFKMAVEFEREIQKRDPEAFLHFSCVPLDQVDFEASKKSKGFNVFGSHGCDSGHCFT